MEFGNLFYLSIISLLIINFSESGAEQGYQKLCRELHNKYRAKHHARPLLASDDLNKRAVKCAQYYAKKGRIDHSCPYKNGAGENLFMQFGGNPSMHQVAQGSVNSWYSEVKQHNFNKDYQPGSGHFTQMVWKNSRHFGFGVARSGNSYIGCALFYSPHGNMLGGFNKNVKLP